MSANWRQEVWPLVGSVGFGAVTLGVFVVAGMYFADVERYESGAYLAGLMFFGFVISLSTFFVILIYGAPFYFLFRRFGLNGLHYYLLVGLLPAIPVLVQNYPEYFAAFRVAGFGGVAAVATWVARFLFFGHARARMTDTDQPSDGVSSNQSL